MLSDDALLLGIETSCDDTGAALLEGRDAILSSIVSGQDEVHAPHGGVVPELASRSHLEALRAVVWTAFETAHRSDAEVEAVGVTHGPGLLGSLLVGLSFAKAYALARNVPVIAVNHIEAHLASAWLAAPDTPHPALSLVVSGGHSHLFLCRSPWDLVLVAATRDDAAGEALDKIAKIMGLPYPGGPVIDRLAPRGDDCAFSFTLPKMADGSLDYSFSGLKTAVLHHLRRIGKEPPGAGEADLLPSWELDLLASFQKSVVDHLLQRVRAAAKQYAPKALTLAGGVACNRLLRRRMEALAAETGLAFAVPDARYCTDNAAIVAFRARQAADAGRLTEMEVDAFPTAGWPSWRTGGELPSAKKKRHR